ncbi:MAG: Ig-like domain-containing protein, partial [Oscillospiraceae bacterium]|nr:Ig-like domain-containing protein [Oscillospiraceae bacterium]
TLGATETTFDPNGGVTRQQAAVFLYRYAQSYGLELTEGEEKTFTDAADISGYATDAVAALSAAGVISGYPNGSFLPGKVITRAEAATMFIRFVEAILPVEVPDPVYYSVSFVAPHVTVTVDGAETTFCTLLSTESLTFSVEAEEDYVITSVDAGLATLTANEDGTYTLSDVTENVIVTVVAEPVVYETYAVSFNAQNAEVTVDGQTITGAVLAENESLTFAATAAEGYAIYSVTTDNGVITDNGDGTYTLSGLTGNATVYVVAVEDAVPPVEPEIYTITFVTDEGVDVYVDGEVVESVSVSSDQLTFSFGFAMVEEHTQVATAEVSPAGSLYCTGSGYVLTGITGDTTVTLTTGPELMAVSFYTGDGATAVDTVYVPYGMTLELPAEPGKEGYFFGGWYTDVHLLSAYDVTTPVTEDMILYAAFGALLEEVHYDYYLGSNLNDGATKDTSVATMEWAIKLAAHSTSKSIIMHTGGYLLGSGEDTVEEIWDASEVEGGIHCYLDPALYTRYSTWCIYVNGFSTLTVKNMHFYCEDATDYSGACFANIYTNYNNATSSYVFGTLTLIDCTATGFGTLPLGNDGYDSFYSYVISNYGNLTIEGGSYYGNRCAEGGVINNYHGYSTMTVDGVTFYDNTATPVEGITYGATGAGGAILINGSDNCMTIRNCTFRNNTAAIGGAIWSQDADNVIIEDCVFENNTASGNGGAITTNYAGNIVFKGDVVFEGNTASGSGGAIYYYNATTVGCGVYRNNTAGLGNDIFGRGHLTVLPEEGATLELSSGITAGGTLYLGGTIAGLEKPVCVQPMVADPGITIMTGSNYTITEADLAKVTINAEAELVLDTGKNVIKIAKKNEGGGDDGGDEGGESGTLSTVYLSGSGNDDNSGDSSSKAVKTFEKAKSLLAPNGTIYITGTVTVNAPETWSLDPEIWGDAVVKKSSSMKYYAAVTVSGTLTLENISIDGDNIASYQPFFSVSGGTLSLKEGCEIVNCNNTSSYGAAVHAGSGTVRIEDAKISNCNSKGSYGGAITGGTIIMTSGEISGCTGTGTYGGAALCGDSITLSGGTITGNTGGTSNYSALLWVKSGGSFTMTGGTISNNSGKNGIGHMGNATFEISGGEISGNTLTDSVIGTGYTGGTVRLYGGTVSNNTVGNGGCISVPNNATVIVDGITIKDNKATNGGAIYLATSGSVTFLSGTITGNSATKGGDIYLGDDLLATFTPNEKGLTIDGEIYLNNTSASYFGTDGSYIGDLSNLNGQLKFNFANLNDGVFVGTPVAGYSFTEADLAKIGSTGCNMGYEINADGKIITKTQKVEQITLDATATVMATYTVDLTATIAPENATSMALTWTSSNTSVARVSGSSLTATVSGVAPGEAVIRATAADGSGVYAECVVTVTENTTPIESVTLNYTEYRMEEGEYVLLRAAVNPSNAYDTTLTWTCSDDSVVGLMRSDSYYRATALKDGTATITVTAADGKTATCVITVSDTLVESIDAVAYTETIYVGDTAAIDYTILPADATVQDVTWASGDETIAKVELCNGMPLVVGLAEGTVTITGTTVDGGHQDSVTFNVVKHTENAMELDLTELKLINFQSFNITALFDVTEQAVTWTSNNSEVVAIHAVNGKQVTIKAGIAGSAVITATAEDGQTASCLVTVENRVAGTLDEVHVFWGDAAYTDSNDGKTPETAVRSLARAIELLGVNGTIYVHGKQIDIPDGSNITLPKEIYGDAKIVMCYTYERTEEQRPGRPPIVRVYEYAPWMSISGKVQFSDVTISWEEGGDTNFIFQISDGDEVIYSNGAVFLGHGGTEYDQILMTNSGGKMLMNGGEILNFYAYRFIWLYSTDASEVTINGGTITPSTAQKAKMFDISRGKLTVNGGTFNWTMNSSSSYFVGIYYDHSYIYGGTFNTSESSYNYTSLAYLYGDATNLTIDAKYDLVMNNCGIYSGTDSPNIYFGSLRKLQGVLEFHMAEKWYSSGKIIAEGTEGRLLTWEELSKISFTGGAITLDLEQNGIKVV